MKGGSKSASRARVASRTRKSATKTVSRKPASKSAAKKTSGKSGRTGAADDRIELAARMAELLDKHSLSELIVETGDLTLTMRRGVSSAPVMQTAPVHHVPAVMHAPAARDSAAEAPTPAAAPAAAESTAHKVTSPFVGTFYRSPSPDAEPYVKEGQRVEKGQVLCIVEAMKLMNEIEADQTGIISSILVQDAEPVEYGQALFEISPA